MSDILIDKTENLTVKDILGLIDRDEELIQALQTAEMQNKHLNISGLVEPQKAYLLAALALKINKRLVVITSDAARARQMKGFFRPFVKNRVDILFPENIDFVNSVARSRELENGRVSVITKLLNNDFEVVIICAGALLNKYEGVEEARQKVLTVKFGEQIDVNEFKQKLVDLGYERCSTVNAQGEFASRGDVLDVFPPNLVNPVRINFFDDEIDMIKEFDMATQRSINNLTEVSIGPARQYIIDDKRRDEIAELILKEANANADEMKGESGAMKVASILRKTSGTDSELILNKSNQVNLNKYVSVLWEQNDNILKYIDVNRTIVAVDEVSEVKSRSDMYYAEHMATTTRAYENGAISRIGYDALFTTSDMLKILDKLGNVLALSCLPSISNGLPGGIKVNVSGVTSKSYKGNYDGLATDIKRIGDQGVCALCASSGGKKDRLLEELKELDIFQGKSFAVLDTPVPAGFTYYAVNLMVIGEEDVWGRDTVKHHKGKSGKEKLNLFDDIKPGDFVVHDAHGIGRYIGFEKGMAVGNTIRDYFKIEYANGDILRIPVDNPNSIQKYVGPNNKQPKLSNLNSSDWAKKVTKAKSSIKKLAFDLLQLYAARRACKGFKCEKDDEMQKEFEESFPFVETYDQIAAIKDIKSDMESDLPMDRLLCGDVGFGKTEVAFRAIFKAVTNGKQAFMIAPTTLLAQQHYDNFLERSKGFPVKVAILSRFTSSETMKGYLKDIKSGRIDVVIGTHRVLSKDVKPLNLGLLVIDEEQRFGVNHKEQIKNYKNTIDVLTLTATPIPRTLHMSMMGIRDISVLQEAPINRRPVQTYVVPFDSEMISQAILREVSRQGQVFYLHNKTADIEDVATKLSKLLPGVKITYAHGRMSELQLENIVNSFILGEYDVLVCTTIIESGVDMPNVNTIIVEDSDRFGLAQLYQIKGRVGRSDKQAYAYITYDDSINKKSMNDTARKRLMAIRDFTELGSGIKIAMADLEVRGAGDLLGAEQHGHMDVIGYELYTRLLDEEIKLLRKQVAEGKEGISKTLAETITSVGSLKSMTEDDGKTNEKGANKFISQATIEALLPVNVNVKIDFDSYIPAEYIEDEEGRISAYRRMALINSKEVYDDFIDELLDRYGEPTREIYLLAGVSLVRSFASRMAIDNVVFEGKKVYLYFAANRQVNMKALSALYASPKFSSKVTISGTDTPYLLYKSEKADKVFMLSELIEILDLLVNNR